MNLRKHKQDDALDLSLRRSLQNWAARQHPPADGRSKLLRAALQANPPHKKNANPGFMFLQSDDVPVIRTNGVTRSSTLVLSQGFDTWQVQFQVSQSFTARLVC